MTKKLTYALSCIILAVISCKSEVTPTVVPTELIRVISPMPPDPTRWQAVPCEECE